jgi:hypothetical protein
MPETSSDPGRLARYPVEIKCPECSKSMILHVGLTGDPKNNLLECPNCQKEFVPLVPGPIVGGPFPVID